eukprot:2332931-Rhodomonas_salina.7
MSWSNVVKRRDHGRAMLFSLLFTTDGFLSDDKKTALCPAVLGVPSLFRSAGTNILPSRNCKRFFPSNTFRILRMSWSGMNGLHISRRMSYPRCCVHRSDASLCRAQAASCSSEISALSSADLPLI